MAEMVCALEGAWMTDRYSPEVLPEDVSSFFLLYPLCGMCDHLVMCGYMCGCIQVWCEVYCAHVYVFLCAFYWVDLCHQHGDHSMGGERINILHLHFVSHVPCGVPILFPLL